MTERLTEHEAHEGIYEKYPDYISATEKLAYYEDLKEHRCELSCFECWLAALKGADE